MKLLYFARVREIVGVAEETLSCPAQVRDVAALIGWLRARGPQYEAALCNPRFVRVAVNQTHVGLDHPVRDGDEIAIFPPVTGG